MTTLSIYSDPSGVLKYLENVPEEPKVKIDCVLKVACRCAEEAFENGANRDVVDYYDDNCINKYQKRLEAVKASGIVISNQEEVKEFIDNYFISKGEQSYYPINAIYQLPADQYKVEVSEFCNKDSCAEECINPKYCVAKPEATILPVKEHEESQEELWKEAIDLFNSTRDGYGKPNYETLVEHFEIKKR